MYIANQQRDGDLGTFFSHENQCHPPSLSDLGNLRLGQKSALLTCLNVADQPASSKNFDAEVFDGSAVVHFLPTSAVKTFDEYAEKVFLPFMVHHLEDCNSIDCIWDRYITSSLKEMTRVHRGSGLHIKVSGQTKLPRKWNDFLRDARNVKELFDFLTNKLRIMSVPENKEIFVTSGDDVIGIGTEHGMSQCNHEEADTRIIIHVQDSLQRGSNTIMVRTVDTDVVVLLVGHFYSLRDQHPSADIWVAFGTGKHFCYYHINTICANLGVERSWALPPFHAFTGCDTTSSFFGRSKKYAWQAWSAYPEATEAFVHIAQHPYEPISLSSEHFLTLERFTVVLYHISSSLTTVNEARRELFCKKSKSLENIPPTQDALFQHTKRAII